MQLVLELPPPCLARCGGRQPEQDAAIHLQTAGTNGSEIGEELRSDAMVLLADRRELADWTSRAIGLKSGFDHRAEIDPCLPRVSKDHVAGGGRSKIFFKE